jgi:hypothetical protein
LKRTVIIAAVALFAAGCSWLGLPTDFEPSGEPFTLKPEVSFVRALGAAPDWNPNGWTTIGFEIRGDTAAWVETLPGGLFFSSGSKRVQNIILLKRHIIRGLPNDTVLPIGGFCVNSTRDLPDEGDVLTPGPLTDNADLKRLVDALRDKDIRLCGWLQSAVWEVTDGGSLSESWFDSIANLPPDTGGFACGSRPDRRARKQDCRGGR